MDISGGNRGPPEHRASGILYGIPDNGTQIPDHFYANMGFNNHRTGGAQLPAPCRGWTYGYDEFVVSIKLKRLLRNSRSFDYTCSTTQIPKLKHSVVSNQFNNE